MNSWFKILYIVVLSSWTWITAEAQTAGSCTSTSFSRRIGVGLPGREIAAHQVLSNVRCREKCAENEDCLSLNLATHDDGTFICQFNNANTERSSSD